MGEENNNGIAFYSDGALRIGGYDTLSVCDNSRNDTTNVPNFKDELVIPELLDKVLKKTINNLKDIRIDSYEKITQIEPYSFGLSYKYRVNLVLTFSWDSQICYTASKLGEIINDSFRVMYNNIENFKFNIIRVSIEQRDYDKEFFEFFTKK